MCFLVEDDVAEIVFLEWLHLEQYDVAHDGVEDFRVVERLISVINGFRIDARAVFGVVFDLDC